MKIDAVRLYKLLKLLHNDQDGSARDYIEIAKEEDWAPEDIPTLPAIETGMDFEKIISEGRVEAMYKALKALITYDDHCFCFPDEPEGNCSICKAIKFVKDAGDVYKPTNSD